MCKFIWSSGLTFWSRYYVMCHFITTLGVGFSVSLSLKICWNMNLKCYYFHWHVFRIFQPYPGFEMCQICMLLIDACPDS
uniref:Uncharacterized protein n=1 Tax=Rhizophora mucronata TaxID=61149 RepID=A0A2P2JD81_RHIMU